MWEAVRLVTAGTLYPQTPQIADDKKDDERRTKAEILAKEVRKCLVEIEFTDGWIDSLLAVKNRGQGGYWVNYHLKMTPRTLKFLVF